MLRDITIGQYFPKDSLLHRLDPRVKIVLTLCYIIMLFAASNPIGLIIGIVFLAVAYGVSGIPAAMILKSLKYVFYCRGSHLVILENPDYSPGALDGCCHVDPYPLPDCRDKLIDLYHLHDCFDRRD